MRRAWPVAKRTIVAFYDDQMTHHAAALTYYALMSLFPAMLLGLSPLPTRTSAGRLPLSVNGIAAGLRNTG